MTVRHARLAADRLYRRPPFFRWLFSRGHLKTITLLPFLAITLLGFSGAWLISRINSERTITGMMEMLSESIDGKVAQGLSAFLKVPRTQNSSNAIMLGHSGGYDSPEILYDYFLEQLRLNPEINILSYGSTQGEYVEAQRQPDGSVSFGVAGSGTGGALELWQPTNGTVPGTLLLRRPDYDPRQRPWYLAALESDRGAWSPVYPYYSNQALAMAAVDQVRDRDNTLLGVVSATFTLNDFSTYLRDINTGDHGFIIIFEENGTVVATSLLVPLLDEASGRRLYATDESIPIVRDFVPELQSAKTMLRINTTDGPYVVSKKRIEQPGLKWYTLVFLKVGDFSGAMELANRQSAILLSGLLVASLLIGWVVNGYITLPISTLGEAATALRLPDNADATLPSASAVPAQLLARKDEIGRLAQAFELMRVELQRTFERLGTSLNEKDILLQEINHRVKNNLQLINSLLNLQAERIADPELLASFKIARDRIYSLSLLHEELYSSGNLATLEMSPFMYRMRDEIRSRAPRNGACPQIELVSDPVQLSIVQAVPFGLIFHELLTNAVNHAYKQSCEGIIHASLRAEPDGWLRLEVADSGTGLRGPEGLGLTLVRNLVAQLRGTVSLSQPPGLVVSIRFKPQST